MNGLDIHIYGYIWHSCSFYSNCRKWFQSIYCYYINSCPLQMENNTFGIEPHLIPIDGWLVIFTCKGCNLRQNVGLGWCNYFVLTTLRFGIFFSDFLGSTKWWLWGMGWYGTGISTAQGFKDCNFQPGCRSSQYIQPVDLFYEERLRKFNLFILTISWSHWNIWVFITGQLVGCFFGELSKQNSTVFSQPKAPTSTVTPPNLDWGPIRRRVAAAVQQIPGEWKLIAQAVGASRCETACCGRLDDTILEYISW